MAHRKAGGSAKNLKDSQPKYLGVKLQDGEKARAGNIIIRQRGTRYLAGKNVGIGKDHTLFALIDGKIEFKSKRKIKFNGKVLIKKIINVIGEKQVKKIKARRVKKVRPVAQPKADGTGVKEIKKAEKKVEKEVKKVHLVAQPKAGGIEAKVAKKITQIKKTS